ncbi:hypothetical protein D5R81_06900 [Parashewanella spongiae]|uniref:Pentatricopeptide repeat-containing protein n=1 Tax=Parashewanella spongiae TaxID=342950 RepID=A0A3A6TYS8_9GAMM|nr:hypothetical protein [Parashewanella spongiae]MCL1077704.1 hypothetical protein [Parashewanella spongiae]RJY18100.1 hypothetical protein D5R81_06900 [Parashewanella spongiae]
MATVRTPAEQQSIYRFMLKSLQEYPSEAVFYLNSEVSRFDGDENLQQCYQLLSKTDRQKLYDFFNNKSSSTCSNSHTRETHYCKKPSNAYRRFPTEPRSITPKSSTRYTKQIRQPPSSPDSFFTQTSALIHSWKLEQKTKNQLGIELNALIGGCTKLSQLIEIIHSLKNDKQVMETSWDIILIHKLLHKADDLPNSHSSNFDGVFSDITRFKSSYEAKTCILLLKLIKLNLNFSDAKRLVLGNAAEVSLMQQWGIKPNVAIYNVFITVCAKTGQFDSAWQLVCGDMPVMASHLSLKANKITCTNLLTACAETGRYAEAKSLVLGDGDTASLMQQWVIKPNVAIYNAFITICAKTGQFDSAWQLMCGDKPVMAPHLPLKADLITCLNLLTACAEAGRYAEAKSLVLGDGDTTTASLMQQWGIKPDVVIYSAFIKVCIKAKEFDTGIWCLENILNKCHMNTLSQIHAQLAPLEKDNFASMIDKGIAQGIYKKNVGLINHCIDLHMDKIFEGHSGNDTHIRGVPLAFAKLLFCYHKQNNEPKITSVITGYHGNNTLKNGMISFLKDEFGLEFIEDEFNSGMIVLSESTHIT